MVAARPQKPSRALPLLKTLVFTLVVPGTVVVYLPYWIASSRRVTVPEEIGLSQGAGILLAGLGTLGYLWCAWEFSVAGRGTPAPIDPPKILVARGLYRWVRNPMYVSVLLVLLGESLFFQWSALLRYALVVWIILHLWVVFYEEPTLRAKFGESFREYCKAVPRWVPRLPRTKVSG